MIRIDDTRCVRCGLCARVCPLHCFHVESDGISIHHEEYCMHCGHCAAACPSAAIWLDDIDPDTLEPLSPLPDTTSLTALIKARRSIRDFKQESVPENVLLQALDTVRYAPTGKNLENVSWLVLEGRDTLRRVADCVIDLFRQDKRLSALVRSHERGADPIFRGAPCAVFACASGEYDLDMVNCSIAVSALDLLLPTMGLGGCWAGYVMRAAALDENVRKAMGTEEGLRPLAGLMVGIPAVSYRRVPARRPLRVIMVKGETA